MKSINLGGWIYFLSGKEDLLEKHKCGKWMYFFGDREFVESICRKAIEEEVVYECKHSDAEEGVACFYLNGDDIENHRRVIEFFLENGLIRRTKTGKLYNIGFKFDDQTRAGEYGVDFKAEIKLDRFLDLTTGEWKETI